MSDIVYEVSESESYRNGSIVTKCCKNLPVKVSFSGTSCVDLVYDKYYGNKLYDILNVLYNFIFIKPKLGSVCFNMKGSEPYIIFFNKDYKWAVMKLAKRLNKTGFTIKKVIYRKG